MSDQGLVKQSYHWKLSTILSCFLCFSPMESACKRTRSSPFENGDDIVSLKRRRRKEARAKPRDQRGLYVHESCVHTHTVHMWLYMHVFIRNIVQGNWDTPLRC